MTDEQVVKAVELLRGYRLELDYLYALGIECALGFSFVSKEITEGASSSYNKIGMENKVFYGRGDPNDKKSRYQHSSKFQEVVNRNKKNGQNTLMINGAILVFAYMHWEDGIRGKFAEIIGVSKMILKTMFLVT